MPQLFRKSAHATIPFSVIVYMAWSNLVSKKLRSLLTIMGVIIGIGAIFFLLSLGLGLQRLVTDEVIGNESVKSISVATPNSRILQLDTNVVEAIDGLQSVERVGATYTFSGSIELNRSEINSIVYGIDEAYQELSNMTVLRGELLKQDDTQSAFINSAALAATGIKDSKEVIGKTLRLRVPLQNNQGQQQPLEHDFKVVGVIDSGSGSEIFIPSSIFEQAGVSQYAGIKLSTSSTEAIPDVRKKIESMGFETTSPIDTIDEINQIFRYFNALLVGFGAIGMIVAVLGMFNTLTISLLERTREIGLMVALGGRKRDMRKLFLVEAVLLSLVGSIIGILLAVISGFVINVIMNGFAQNRGVTDGFSLFATPWWLIVGLIGFMVCVGLAVVYFPARRAERINPIDALRRE